jgi:HlyD family secretion protein
MRKRWPTRIVYGLVGLGLAGAAWWALREQPVQVDVAIVRQGPMEVLVREEGVTRVRDVYTVSVPIAGHLARTTLQEGDRVEAGKTVVAAIHPLDPPLIDLRSEAELRSAREAAISAVRIAEGDLRRAETALKLAEDEEVRALKLFRPGVISESALERFTNEVALEKAAVEAAQATVALRRAELSSAEARLTQPTATRADEGCCMELRAPVSGTVLAIHARSEQAVTPGAPILDVGDTANLEIVVDLLTDDAVRIEAGTRARIVGWGGQEHLPAAVRRVDPAAFTKVSALGIEEQRVHAILDLERPEPRLGHGFRVIAEIVAWECPRCLLLPISALFRVGDHWQVFRLVDGRAQAADVTVGRMNEEVGEVIGGLQAGDEIVLHPTDALYDGRMVEMRD